MADKLQKQHAKEKQEEISSCKENLPRTIPPAPFRRNLREWRIAVPHGRPEHLRSGACFLRRVARDGMPSFDGLFGMVVFIARHWRRPLGSGTREQWSIAGRWLAALQLASPDAALLSVVHEPGLPIHGFRHGSRNRGRWASLGHRGHRGHQGRRKTGCGRYPRCRSWACESLWKLQLFLCRAIAAVFAIRSWVAFHRLVALTVVSKVTGVLRKCNAARRGIVV